MLVYLTPNDFFVTQQNQLAIKIQGFSLVFFSSSNCKYCKDVMPAFVQLSSSLQGCAFGLMNVDQDGQKIVGMAASTRNRLEYVPYVMLYVHGIPLSVFAPDERNPGANYELMKRFLIETTSALKSGDRQATAEAQSPYSIGIPGNKKRVCYLNFEKAYAGK